MTKRLKIIKSITLCLLVFSVSLVASCQKKEQSGAADKSQINASLQKVSSQNVELQLKGLRELEQHGEASLGALPIMIDLLDHPEPKVARGASDVIASMGEPAVPYMLKFVNSYPSDEEYLLSFRALGRMGADGLPALEEVIDGLDHPQKKYRLASLVALEGILKGLDGYPLSYAQSSNTSEGKSQDTEELAKNLNEVADLFDLPAKPKNKAKAPSLVLPSEEDFSKTLISLLNWDDDPEVRLTALKCLMASGLSSDRIKSAVDYARHDPDARVQEFAIRAYGKLIK